MSTPRLLSPGTTTAGALGLASVFRITAGLHAETAFQGEGARLFGGRWNSPGIPVVYTAATLSLAALEFFVNVDPDLAPDDLVWFEARLAPGLPVQVYEEDDLPSTWRDYPAPEEVQAVGDAWALEAAIPVLSLPSVVIPQERNLLLNPDHPRLEGLEIRGPEAFQFDPRMWRSRGAP